MGRLDVELGKWTKYVYNDIAELYGQEVHIKCTYAEVFKIPFKINDHKYYSIKGNKLYSYDKKHKYLYLRKNDDIEYWAGILKGEPDNDTAVAKFLKWLGFKEKEQPTAFYHWLELSGEFPEALRYYSPSKVADNGAWKIYTWNDSITVYEGSVKLSHLPIGTLTGRYYLDVYGFVWLEMHAYYLKDVNQIAWIRDSAIKYNGQTEIQPLFDIIRQGLWESRLGEEEEEKKSGFPSWLTALGLFLLTSHM